MRVRGLKRVSTDTYIPCEIVAPHAGAWIETDNIPEMSSPVTSHPMRVRGLKPVSYLDQLPKILSHPMRVRGLKQEVIQKLQC